MKKTFWPAAAPGGRPKPGFQISVRGFCLLAHEHCVQCVVVLGDRLLSGLLAGPDRAEDRAEEFHENVIREADRYSWEHMVEVIEGLWQK